MITANNATLADRMRDARKRAGLKQRDLTHIASRSQIGRIERGEVYSPETIDAWAAACGVSAEWLRTGVESALEAHTEPDRSGWPVLVKSGTGWFDWPNGRTAIFPSGGRDGTFRAWSTDLRMNAQYFPTALAAAEALHARLPDEVSESNHLAADPLPAPTEAEAVEIEREASAGAIAAIVRLGHTEHCAKRLAWGDGECECKPSGHTAFAVNLNDYASVTLTADGMSYYNSRDHRPGSLTGAVYRDQAWSLLSTLARCLRIAGPHWIEGNVVTFESTEAPAAVAPQPPPTNATGDVWQELIDAEPPGRIRDLMAARREQGIAKYGRPLGRENGRDHTADAIQEALDGMVYAQAAPNEPALRSFRDALCELMGLSSHVGRVEAHLANDAQRLEKARAAVTELRGRADAAEAKHSELLGTHLAFSLAVQGRAIREGAPEHECKAWYAGRDAIRQHVEAKERRATEAENEAAGLRTSVDAFRRAACIALGYGEDATPGDWTLLRDLRACDIKGLTARAESAEAEVARLRAALEGQTLANAPLRDALSFLRGRLAFLVSGDDATDAAIVAAAKALADRDDGQDDALLGAGLGLLDQAALGNPTLGYIATVIRRGVGRG